MNPLKLTAPCKDYLWGGTKLKTEYHQQSSAQKLAESWELSCHEDGLSVIAEGAFAGLTLKNYIDRAGRGVLGTDCGKFEQFPILVKLIDAKERLSVQVHPNNDYALQNEGGYGKTEMWYVVENEPGASLYYGFQRKISKEEFAQRIANNTLLEVLNKVEVHPGDVFFIESGTLHAIGAGILVAEIQQNSNSTYRIYDYARVGADGKLRELHIAKALDVTKLEPSPARLKNAPEDFGSYSRALLASCEYFTVYEMDITAEAPMNADGTSFHSILCLDGKASLCNAEGELLSIEKGGSIFVPAGMGKYAIKGKCKILFTRV